MNKNCINSKENLNPNETQLFEEKLNKEKNKNRF